MFSGHQQRSCSTGVPRRGATAIDIAQAAILLGWTKDAVRAACERGELAHSRDHLNAYRLPCSAVAAAARSQLKEREGRPGGMDPDK